MISVGLSLFHLYCYYLLLVLLLLVLLLLLLLLIMPWDARDFLADFYSLNYSAGDAVTANLVNFECL
jgi:hypothetical protein